MVYLYTKWHRKLLDISIFEDLIDISIEYFQVGQKMTENVTEKI